jgi:hypothetical protein
VFEDRVLRRIFGSKRDEVMGRGRTLHNLERLDLYSLPIIIIIGMIKLRMGWVGHIE